MKEDELDRQLFEMFAKKSIYNEQKHADMLREVTTMYAAKTRRAKYLTWGTIGVSTMLILFCALRLMMADSVNMIVLMGVLILIFHETTVLMKLWWWTFSSRNEILQSLKEMQLQIVEIQAANNAAGNDKSSSHQDCD